MDPYSDLNGRAATLEKGREVARNARDLKVKLFADGADKACMLQMHANPLIQGFTTNPTLMRRAGVKDYEAFAKEVLAAIPNRPISFEVFADDFPEMERQARKIASWGSNVYVKIPVTNTRREPSYRLVRRLTHDGVKVNVTALLTLEQASEVADALAGGAPSGVSIFAGRIADTGVDPVPIMAAAVKLLRSERQIELIWGSPRELLNIFQADAIGCHIITATADLLKKLDLIGKDLNDYSLETVEMFHQDARQAGYTI
jgi:transaldolase